MDELPLNKVLIQMHDPNDRDLIDEIVLKLTIAIDDDDVGVKS